MFWGLKVHPKELSNDNTILYVGHESSMNNDDTDDVIVYPDIIDINTFANFFIMKTGQSPSNIDWLLFHKYDTNNNKNIFFEDFMEIVEMKQMWIRSVVRI